MSEKRKRSTENNGSSMQKRNKTRRVQAPISRSRTNEGSISVMRRSMSNSMRNRNNALNKLVSQVTKSHVETIQTTMKNINNILDEIIFDYLHEESILNEAVQTTGLKSENREIIESTLKTFSKTKQVFIRMKECVVEYISSLNHPLNNEVIIRALKLNSLLMFLTAPFDDAKIAKKRFISNLIQASLSHGEFRSDELESIMDMFKKKHNKRGTNHNGKSFSNSVKDSLTLPSGIKIDLVRLQELDDMKLLENTKELRIVPVGNARENREASNKSGALEDEKIQRLAERIIEKYNNPSEEDLRDLDGTEIVLYIKRYVKRFFGKSLGNGAKDINSMVEKVGEKTLEKLKEPLTQVTSESLLAEKISSGLRQLTKFTDPEAGSIIIKNSRSHTTKLIVFGFHLIANQVSKAASACMSALQTAKAELREPRPLNTLDSYESDLKLPKEFENLYANILLLSTDAEYRVAFLNQAYTLMNDSKDLPPIAKQLMNRYMGAFCERSKTSASQNAEVFTEELDPIANAEKLTASLSRVQKSRVDALLERLGEQNSPGSVPGRNAYNARQAEEPTNAMSHAGTKKVTKKMKFTKNTMKVKRKYRTRKNYVSKGTNKN